MKSVEYSQLVKRKLLKLKKELIGEYGEEKTKEILTAMADHVDMLGQHEESGVSISRMYDIDTDYFTWQVIYSITCCFIFLGICIRYFNYIINCLITSFSEKMM